MLLARARLAGQVGLAGVVGASIVNGCFAPDRVAVRIGALAAQGVLSLIEWRLARRVRRRRVARAMVVSLNLGIAAVLLYQLTLSPTDLDVLIGPIICMMIGTALIFPWGTAAQATMSTGLSVGYLCLVWQSLPSSGMRAANVSLSLALSTGMSVLGALILERSRFATFLQRERVRALARQRHHLYTAALRANALKSEFVATMSHELRTPLNVILGFAEMARDAVTGPIERARCLERIDAAGRDLLTLIESTLQVGRLEAGRDELQLEPVEFLSFWQALGDACARMVRDPAVALEWEPDVPGITLTTDPGKLTVIIRNLVCNGLKFTERGHVRAVVTLEDQAIAIRVADTGVGIRAADRDLIFELFRQADGSPSRRYGGTGLGLYIVRRFAEQLGGTVTVESTLGAGSVFTVRLPIATTLAAPASEAA